MEERNAREVIKDVVQAAGFELTDLLDKPTAVNAVLKMQNSAVMKGLTHFSLVISGAYEMDFAEADL